MGVFAAISATAWGLASDFIGRRRAIIIAAVVSAVLAVPTYYLVYYSAAVRGIFLLVLGAFLMGWVSQWIWGLMPRIPL